MCVASCCKSLSVSSGKLLEGEKLISIKINEIVRNKNFRSHSTQQIYNFHIHSIIFTREAVSVLHLGKLQEAYRQRRSMYTVYQSWYPSAQYQGSRGLTIYQLIMYTFTFTHSFIAQAWARRRHEAFYFYNRPRCTYQTGLSVDII